MAVIFAAYRVIDPHAGSPDTLDLSIDVPAVAPGVGKGTKVIIRGAEVGEVSELAKTHTDAVRMSLSLRSDRIRGLTDAFDIDFRPENYFGVTAVNLVGRPGGGRLMGGQVLNRIPVGDYTMSTMIEKGSIAVDGTLSESMIATLDKIIRYTDGLTPMIQTGILVADRVTQTQQALPSTLLTDMNNTLEVLPAFNRQAVDALANFFDNKMNRLPDGSYGVDEGLFDMTNQGLTLAATDLFGAAGKLLASHGAELTPVTQIVTALSDTVPHLLDGGTSLEKLATLVDRYNKSFTGPEHAKTLNVRLILDDLPAFATPLALTDLPQPPDQKAPK
ncbi:Mce family protein [Nocardia sp. R6R-6]|uniref:Mce family protein n=1 Tax=Nocardia sp. R6R-6 TaxID=3459303 RepID=UPI00403DB30A